MEKAEIIHAVAIVSLERERKEIKEMLKAISILTATGLKFCSSDRQIQNGTLCFEDPKDYQKIGREKLPIKYTIHRNGYYRKCLYSFESGKTCYQLNRTKKIYSSWNWNNSAVERILLPGQYTEMATRISNLIIKNRQKNLLKSL